MNIRRQNKRNWALAQVSIAMSKADLWHARLALMTPRLDQREATKFYNRRAQETAVFCGSRWIRAASVP